MKTYDVIIIGGGLGGLTAGAKLAKEGKKVLLIEQNHTVGGCATTFTKKGYDMEASLHEIDGLDAPDFKTNIFHNLGIFDTVKFLKIPEFYRFTNGRINIVIPDNVQEATQVLTKKFPEEKEGIIRFFTTIHDIYMQVSKLPQKKWQLTVLLPIFPLLFPAIVSNKSQTVGEFLDSIIQNEDLKLILTANISYYHDDPYSLSLIYFSMAQSSYFRGGGHYVRGGSQKLSNAFASIIKNKGGEILLNSLVTKVIMKNEEAVGVEYRKTGDTTSEGEQAFAHTIIANTSIPNVVPLLPKQNQAVLLKKIQKLEKSCSFVTISMGFKKEVKKLGNKHYSTFVLDESIQSQKDLLKNYRGDLEKRTFAFVDYSQIDSGLVAPKGKSFGTIAFIDYIVNWEKLNNKEYKKKKEEVAQIFFKRLEKLIPGITAEIDVYEVATPLTIQRYTLNPGGSVYGFSQIPSQSGRHRISNKSPIKNLYFASAWGNPGGGFTGAILGGWFCANEVLKR